jgi:hypothetical protein
MSNNSLQSLVKQQSLETEKFNSNLLPPIQTLVVLVSNGREEGVGNNGTGVKSSGSAILPLDGFSETTLSSLSSSSSSLIGHSASGDSIRRPNEIIDDLKRNNNNVDREEEEDDKKEEEEIVPESLQEELRRLENTIREEHETSERIMAQNIALLADLEAAQRMVRELRSGKNALALQLRNALQLAENR